MASVTISGIRKHWGVSRTKVMKSIKSGILTGIKDDNGWWTFETSEIVRCFGEPVPNTPNTPEPERTVTPVVPPENNTLQDKLISNYEEQVSQLREQLAVKDEQIERLQETRLIEQQNATRGWFKKLFS